MNLKALNSPVAYLALQSVIGGMNARFRMLEDYVTPKKGDRILDIGCGPGFLSKRLQGTDYVGFDVDRNYISYAQSKYNRFGTFHAAEFDRQWLDKLEKFDLVLMNGLLHHLDDAAARSLLELSGNALKPDGRIFTLDGCYQAHQGAIAKWFLDSDRGKFVRSPKGYADLVPQGLKLVRAPIHEDYMYIPYSMVVMEIRHAGGS